MFDQLNSWVASELSGASGALTWALLFLGGVLASLLPCVYPLYPVTAAILRGRKSPLGRAAHPLAYYLGLAGTYLVLGVVAALTGGAFNELIRAPGFNLAVGGLFALLAGAVVGLVHFPVLAPPAAAEGERHGLWGTVAMGAGAGMLSSACVGPVVVSVLVGLIVQAETVTAGLVLTAGGQMFAFGLGVGLPVVLIGVFGVALPRAGQWMVWIQRAFGLLIAYFALIYLAKGLAGIGLDDASATAVSWGAVLVFAAALWFQDEALPITDRGRRAYLVLAALSGVFVMARGLLPGLATPGAVPGAGVGIGAGAAAEQAAVTISETEHGLTWYLDKELAYEEASRTGKRVFVDFYGSWCTNCKAFQTRLGRDEDLKAALADAVLLKVYDKTPLFYSYRDDERFPELSVGLPFFLITEPDGTVVYKTNDFTRTDEMMLFLGG